MGQAVSAVELLEGLYSRAFLYLFSTVQSLQQNVYLFVLDMRHQSQR